MIERGQSSMPVAGDKRDQIAPAQAELQQMLASVGKSLANERDVRGWLRSLATPYRWLLALLTVVVLTFGVAMVVPRASEFYGYAAFRLWGSLGLYGLLLILLVMQALRPLHWIESSARAVYALGTLALLTPYGIALWPGRATSVGMPKPDCFLVGGLVGVSLIVLLRGLDRGGRREPRSILLGAAAAGIAGNLALMFHCADDRALHLLIAHAPLGFMLWLGYRQLEKRASRRSKPPSLSV